MNRDAHTDFAFSAGLREAVAEAYAERLERQAIERDRVWIRTVLREWERRGRPDLFFTATKRV